MKGLLQFCRLCPAGADIAANVAANASLMRSIIGWCADAFPSVSPISVIAVHHIDGTIEELPDPTVAAAP